MFWAGAAALGFSDLNRVSLGKGDQRMNRIVVQLAYNKVLKCVPGLQPSTGRANSARLLARRYEYLV